MTESRDRRGTARPRALPRPAPLVRRQGPRPTAPTGVRRVGRLPAGPDEPTVAIDLVEVDLRRRARRGHRAHRAVPAAAAVLHASTQEHLAHALRRRVGRPGLGRCFVYDALHDHEAMALWRDAFAAEGHHEYDHREPLAFHRLEGHAIDLTTHSTLFSGEQSNTSVVFGDDRC